MKTLNRRSFLTAAALAAAFSKGTLAQSPSSLTHDIPLAGADPTGQKDSSTAGILADQHGARFRAANR